MKRPPSGQPFRSAYVGRLLAVDVDQKKASPPRNFVFRRDFDSLFQKLFGDPLAIFRSPSYFPPSPGNQFQSPHKQAVSENLTNVLTPYACFLDVFEAAPIDFWMVILYFDTV